MTQLFKPTVIVCSILAATYFIPKPAPVNKKVLVTESNEIKEKRLKRYKLLFYSM